MTKSFTRSFVSVLALNAVIATPVLYAAAETEPETHEVLILTLENDLFTGSDNQYTNGLSATWSSDDLTKYKSDHFARKLGNFFSFAPGFDPTQEGNFVGISLVHEMNTPSDIELDFVPKGDQPYSGVLLLGANLYTDHGRWGQAWNFSIGAVGPITQTDHIQTEFHELIGAAEPQGWDTQLPNEALVNVGYLAGYDWLEGSSTQNVDWRVRPIVNAELGTFVTALGGGMLFEFGSELEDTLGTTSLGQGLSSTIGVGSQPKKELEWSAYLGGELYGIAHYLPFDGTVFRDSRTGDYDEVFARGSAGVTLRYSKLIASFSINYGGSPTRDNDSDLDYGAISIGWHF